MLKKLLAATVAATFMVTSAMGADFVDSPGPAYGTDKKLGDGVGHQTAGIEWGTSVATDGNDTGSAGGTVNVRPGSSITGIVGNSGAAGDGGQVTYIVNTGDILSAGSGSSLTITGGAGGTGGGSGDGGMGFLGVQGEFAVNGSSITLAKGANNDGVGARAGIGVNTTGSVALTSGTINIGAGTDMAFDDGAKFTGGTGTINVTGALGIGATVGAAGLADSKITSDTNVAQLNIDKMFESIALKAGGGVIVNLDDGVGIGSALALKEGAATGYVQIQTDGESILDGDIDVKNSDLLLNDLGSATKYIANGAITAKNVVVNVETEFTDAVNGDVDANADVSFIGPDAALTGSLDIDVFAGVKIGDGTSTGAANITIASGKTLTNGGDVTVTGESSFSLVSGSRYVTGGDIYVNDKGILNADAGVLVGATTNLALGDVFVDANLDAGAVMNVTNTGGKDLSTIDLDIGVANDGSVVNIDMAGKKVRDIDVLGATLNITGNIEVLGTVDAALASTADYGLTVAKGLDSVVFRDDVTVGSNVLFGENSIVDFKKKLFAGGDVTLAKGADVAFDDDVTVLAGKGITISQDAFGSFSGTANYSDYVTVERGGTLASEALGTTFNGTDVFHVKNGATLDTTEGNIALAGYAEAKLEGKMVIGMTGSNANTIDVTGVTAASVGKTATYEFSKDFAMGVQAGDTATNNNRVIKYNDNLEYNGPMSYSSIFGKFTLANDGTNYDIFVSGAADQITGDGSSGDRLSMLGNLKDLWRPSADQAIDGSLGNAVYENSVLGNMVFTDDCLGQLTENLLDSFATADTSVVSPGTIKSVFRNGTISETMATAIGEIAGINQAIGTRFQQLRGERYLVGEGYGSLILDRNYANRIWAGYLGQFEKADRHNGVDGYDYDSHGFIVGYDRLIGCNFAVGAAFAYSKGDFEDKAADNDNSKLDSYSVNGYATYTANNGLFIGAMGGYTHRKNDIQAMYRNVAKYEDYKSDFWHVGGQIGWDMFLSDSFILTPSVGITYIDGKAKSHWSTLGNVDEAKMKALLLPVELTARYNVQFNECSRLTLEANGGYTYNFKKDGAAADMILAGANLADGTPVILNGLGREQARHTWNAGGGIRYHYKNFDIGAKYDYYHQKDAKAHRVMGTVGLSF